MARPDRTVLKPERFLATVAYDGTDYAGWQVQKTGHSVEAEIEARF